MTTLTLGSQPAELSVVLNADADFDAILRRGDEQDWDDSHVLKLTFVFRGTAPTVSWSATFSGVDASFSKDRVDVNAVIAARPSKVQLWYDELLWATGTVTVNR